MATPSALFTDLYELTMAQDYLARGMRGPAVFELSVRTLPAERRFLVAAGLERALAFLERFRFDAEALAYLESLGRFTPSCLEAFSRLRFTGDVYAVPEGTVVFPPEPLLQVVAPLPEAQIAETALINAVHFGTVVASKGVRSALAAAGRPVIDFGSRRAHEADAASEAARALYAVGFAATSNLEAGRRYGIPVTGTMAHSHVQAHASEAEAFRHFVARYPETTLLVDTYDTERGIERVIDLARDLGNAFRVRAVRLDSGDLAAHAHRARMMLDAAGLERVQIVASGGLDEYGVTALRESGAPVDVFAVGTRVVTSADAPWLDAAYKLVAYDGLPRTKRSEGKATLPGRKQVYRRTDGEGRLLEDVLALADEAPPPDSEPLLRPVMVTGRRVAASVPIASIRERAAREVAALPASMRSIAPRAKGDEPPVRVSAGLQAMAAAVRGPLGES